MAPVLKSEVSSQVTFLRTVCVPCPAFSPAPRQPESIVNTTSPLVEACGNAAALYFYFFLYIPKANGIEAKRQTLVLF